MNTIQSNFSRIQYKNYYNKTQTSNNADRIEVPADNPAPAKMTADNIKANYLVNFKGGIKWEKTDNNGLGVVNHQTAFFREPKTDEIVQNYILETFGNDDEINIVSGACSTGEEAKSYAMMLDCIKDKLNISGFDISKEILEDAKSGDCRLINSKTNLMEYPTGLESENILFDDANNLSEYQKKCRDKFRQYYTPKGEEYSVPVFPNAKQELKDLETGLNNPEEFAKQKKLYDEHNKALKRKYPELAKYTTDISFEEIMQMGKAALESQVNVYQTVRDYSADMNQFDNCSFTQGDIMNLDELYKPNSVNVLLYKNALYHTLCMGDNMLRYMKEDAKDTMDVIAKQMNKVLKPQGLVVFGEDEIMQGININLIKKIMQNNGFRLLQEDNADNIWVKVKDIDKEI